MRKGGVEPPYLAVLDSKSSAYASSATFAKCLDSKCSKIDVLILNSLEFWSGSNPLAAGDTYRETDANGNSVTAVKMEDGSLYMRLDAATGEKQELVLQKDEEVIRILDVKGSVLKEAAFAEAE